MKNVKAAQVVKRMNFTFFEKLRFKCSDRFRTEVNTVISEYDYYRDMYLKNKRFFEELQVYSGFLFGGENLQEWIHKLKMEEPQKLEGYKEALRLLKNIMQFYNIWNCERHRKFKMVNTIKICLRVKNSFREGAKYVAIVKVSPKTSIKMIEEQLQLFKEDKGVINESSLYSSEEYKGTAVDGIVLRRDSDIELEELSEIVLNDFSYHPTTRVISM